MAFIASGELARGLVNRGTAAMIDGIMAQLKAFKDKTLRAQVTKSKTAMQKLVKTYFYCG